MVEWKSFEQFAKEKIGEEGIFQRELVIAVYNEFRGNKEVIRRKIKRFVADNNELEIVQKVVMGKKFPYIQRRR